MPPVLEEISNSQHRTLLCSRRGDSLSVSSRSFGRSVDDVNDLHEVLPVSKLELSESVNVLYMKLNEEKSVISVDYETKQDVEVVPPEPPNLDSNSPDPVYSDNV
ncbi:hypothetical protein Tco_1225423, partial [Tanacetum coccineum]